MSKKERYEDTRTEHEPKKRPRWYGVAWFLILLLLTELALAVSMFIQLGGAGIIENLPIINNPNPTVNLEEPSGLEAPSGDEATDEDTEAAPDENAAKTPIYRKNPIDPNVVNILVLGLDTRKPGGNGRSDVNMIVSLDKKNNTIKLVSMLRDTLVPIEGHDWNRLNTAYIFGGPGLSINTINQVYDMDIQRYVKLDFFAIKDIINAVGGVDISLTDKEINYLRSYGFMVSKGAGVKHLNGDVALAYARIRKIDSDFQRTQRQRNVLTAALGKVKAMGVVSALDLMTKLLPQVKTNISTQEMVSLGTGILNSRSKEMEQLSLPVKGAYQAKSYKKMSILSVDFKKNTQALKEFLYGK